MERTTLLDVDEVANIFGVTGETILSWVAEGALAAIRISRRSIRFTQEDIDEFIARRREPKAITRAATTRTRKGKARC